MRKANASSGLRDRLRWLNRYSLWIHSADSRSSPGPELTNVEMRAYTTARISSATSPRYRKKMFRRSPSCFTFSRRRKYIPSLRPTA